MSEANQFSPEKIPSSSTITKEEKLTLLFEKIVGSDLNLSEDQINSIIDERKQVHKYIHDERMQKHERFKMLTKERKLYFLVTIGFILILGSFILFRAPELFEKFLMIGVGIFGGLGIKELFKSKMSDL